jgi:hypothetical protein
MTVLNSVSKRSRMAAQGFEKIESSIFSAQGFEKIESSIDSQKR